jgi:hypothetical protein
MKKVKVKIIRDKDRGYELLLFPIQLCLTKDVADTMEDGSKVLVNCFKDYYDAKQKAEKLIKDPSRCLEDYYIIFDRGFEILEYQKPREFKLITKKKVKDYIKYEEFYQNIILSDQSDDCIISSLIGNHDNYRISVEDIIIECEPREVFSKGFHNYSQAYEIFVITQYRLLSDEEKAKNRYSKGV